MKTHAPVRASGTSAVARRADKADLAPHPHESQASPQLAAPKGALHDFSRMALPLNTDRPNRTGLPDRLKAGIEHLSGFTMDDVRVRYNSPEPAQFQAHAYAQGAEIHVGPGQQRHLPHEAWHVVQQKQGRVKPTLQMKGVAINDDGALERDADRWGAQASHGAPQQAVTRHRATPLQVSSVHSIGGNSHQVTAAQDGRAAGSVKLHDRGSGMIEVTDLGVNAPHRGSGIGHRLLDSALRTGVRLGGRSVSLDADDKGSGGLINWYQQMGFSQTGVNERGQARFQAPIGKVLGAVAQRKAARPTAGYATVVQRSAAAAPAAPATTAVVTEADLLQWCKSSAEKIGASEDWRIGESKKDFVTLIISNQSVGGKRINLTFHIHIQGSGPIAGSLYGGPNVKVNSQDAPELKHLVASWQHQNANKAAKTPEALSHKSQQIDVTATQKKEQGYRAKFEAIRALSLENISDDEAFIARAVEILMGKPSEGMVTLDVKRLATLGGRDKLVTAYLKEISEKFKQEQRQAKIFEFKIVDLYADAKL
jgi:ribosomal protein S18 acetylase RimI-like enzyme